MILKINLFDLGMIVKLTYGLIIPLLLFVAGCKAYYPSTGELIYLQEIEVTGPLNQPPIHITDSSAFSVFTLSPTLSYSPQTVVDDEIGGHTKVDENGIFQVDTINNNGIYTFTEKREVNIYKYSEKNLTWNVASIYAALDLDYRLSSNFGLFVGLNYSSRNKVSTWGGTAGLGAFSATSQAGIRLDAGLSIQEIAYDAHTVVITRTFPAGGDGDGDVQFSREIDKSAHFDPYISLTFNTTYRDWVFNIFLNGGYSLQTIVSFSSESNSTQDETGYRYYTQDARGESTSGFWNFTPGIYFFIGKTGRLLIGTRFYFQKNDENVSPSSFIIPMVQFDYRL